MKLLLDENLSPRLIASISDLYPGSKHVEDCGLLHAPDEQVWRFALENGFTIVTKDSDFSEISVLRACPPKIIWLRIGNCATSQALSAPRDHFELIQHFTSVEQECCLAISVAVKR